MNPESKKESEDPESMRDINGISGIDSEVTRMMRASGVVMEALRVMIVCAQTGDTQPPGCVGFWRLLNLFCLLNEGLLQLRDGSMGSGCNSRRLWALPGDMPSFSAEQAKTVIHAVLTLLQGQLAIFSQFPGQVRAGFQILRGLALGCGLRVSSNFQVTLRVNLTRWVSLACNFSLPLPVVVIDGLYEFMEIQQCDRSVMVHHLVF